MKRNFHVCLPVRRDYPGCPILSNGYAKGLSMYIGDTGHYRLLAGDVLLLEYNLPLKERMPISKF